MAHRRAHPGGQTTIALPGCALLLAVSVMTAAQAAPSPRSPAEDAAFFESRIRPLLIKHCNACHSGKVIQGGLRLNAGDGALRGGDSGPAVVPGKPDESRLIHAIRYTDPRLQMPPSGKLSAAAIGLLEEWVQRGAPWPSIVQGPRSKVQGPESKVQGPKSRVQGPKSRVQSGSGHRSRSPEPAKPHWAFRPLSSAPAPPVKNRAWVRNRVDAFVLAKLEAKRLSPSPRAGRRALIRRVSFDLLGLPPAPEEVEAFDRDGSPDAYARLVDRLLASPHYGERWGRHWLDLVRYCDVPEAWAQTEAQPWLYRDWVVQALNEDLPYDQFVLRQLAADEMPDTGPRAPATSRPSGSWDSVRSTGRS
jgi:hypothetical protein